MEEKTTGTTEPPSTEYPYEIHGLEVIRGNKLEQFARKGPPPFGLKERELIILAMGPTRGECPFDTEVWGLNMGYQQTDEMKGHQDKIFLAHLQIKNKETGKVFFDWERMYKTGAEIINIHRIKGVKQTLFPLKRITEKFGTDYFTNTICYMIAYALDKSLDRVDNHFVFKKDPYTRLMLYGVDMQQKDEYQWEKPGIEFWLGIAKGVGIDYTVTRGSALFDTCTGKPYGVKAFNMKDVDPLGLLKKKASTESSTEMIFVNSPIIV